MPTADVTHEQPSRARLQLKKFEPDRLPWMDHAANQQPTTPSEWFSKKFPQHAETFGCPFLEMVQPLEDGMEKITPLILNVDFFAAILGGDPKLGHQVVYVEPEMQFYFYDCRDKMFKPVSEDKLGNLMRAYFMRCAEELPNSVQKMGLVAEFRSDKSIRSIVHRAKSVLAADTNFFGPECKNQRQQQGADIYERVARSFVDQALERQAGEVLTLNEAYVLFCDYLKRKNLRPVKRREFKALVPPAIHEEFALGIRNDLVDQSSGGWRSGWKGIRALTPEPATQHG